MELRCSWMMVVLQHRSKYFECLSNGIKFPMESPSCQEWSRSFHLATEDSECRMWTQLQLHVINLYCLFADFKEVIHNNCCYTIKNERLETMVGKTRCQCSARSRKGKSHTAVPRWSESTNCSISECTLKGERLETREAKSCCYSSTRPQESHAAVPRHAGGIWQHANYSVPGYKIKGKRWTTEQYYYKSPTSYPGSRH